MTCECASLDWSEVDRTQPHHPACVNIFPEFDPAIHVIRTATSIITESSHRVVCDSCYRSMVFIGKGLYQCDHCSIPPARIAREVNPDFAASDIPDSIKRLVAAQFKIDLETEPGLKTATGVMMEQRAMEAKGRIKEEHPLWTFVRQDDLIGRLVGHLIMSVSTQPAYSHLTPEAVYDRFVGEAKPSEEITDLLFTSARTAILKAAVASGDLERITGLFHKLWSRTEYDKEQDKPMWQELGSLLHRYGIVV